MMPEYIITGTSAAILLLAPACALAIVCGCLFGTLSIGSPPFSRLPLSSAHRLAYSYGTGVLYCSAFALLGSIAGLLTGNSRVAAVGDVLPAVLTIVGALAAILLGKSRAYRATALGCALSLSIATFTGTIWGAHMRHSNLNSPGALVQRANTVAECKYQEARAQQTLELRGILPPPAVDLKCSEHPRE